MTEANTETRRNPDYDQRRKKQEALAADQQDEDEPQALESKIKRRPRK